MNPHHIAKINIAFLGSRKELDQIEAVFQWLKVNLGLKKSELYKEALLWILNNEKAREKFREHSSNEKGTRIIINYK